LAALDVNAGGAMRLAALTLPLLARTRRSRFVLVGSSTAFPWGLPDYGGYAASKGAVHTLAQLLNLEWAPLGVTVTELVPPAVDTPLVAAQATPAAVHASPFARRVTPDAVAAVAHALVRGDAGNSPRVVMDLGVRALEAFAGLCPCAVRRLARMIAMPTDAQVAARRRRE
jgi:NAD(P)-dependent dehydrogenase (short-subunit alcohol dehydrogenase family)